jgi:hypothetical protein
MDPTPDPTPFLIDFKDAKNEFFHPQAHYLQSLKPNADETAPKSQKHADPADPDPDPRHWYYTCSLTEWKKN